MSDWASTLEFGPFRVDVLRRSLEREGQPVALTGKAFEILVVLLRQRGEVVGKDALLHQVWPDTTIEENNITVAIPLCAKPSAKLPQAPIGSSPFLARLQFRRRSSLPYANRG